MKLFDLLFDWFSKISSYWEKDGLKFSVYTTIAVLIGGLFELIPPFFLARTVTPIPGIKPYNAIELAGRDVYQREGCNNCHTQMIRPFKWEVDRFDPKKAYGDYGYSKAGEYIYEFPFLWGSKRTGPDLFHESQIQPSFDWHKRHLMNPQETSPGSIMPAYAFLFEEDSKIDLDQLKKHLEGLRKLGVKYTEEDFSKINQLEGKTEGDALIAYLLKLGRDMAEVEKGLKASK